MPGRQARIIRATQLDALLQHVRGRKDVLRCRVIILLSLRAGLRAGEIAKLEWSMVSDPNGKVTHTIELEDRVAKKRSGRRIPIHPELRAALVALQRRTPDPSGPVVKSRRGGHMCPNSIVCWFKTLYNELGFAVAAPTLDDGHSLPRLPGVCMRLAVHCEMFNCWPVTVHC